MTFLAKLNDIIFPFCNLFFLCSNLNKEKGIIIHVLFLKKYFCNIIISE